MADEYRKAKNAAFTAQYTGLAVEPYRDWLIVEQAQAQEMSKGGVVLPSRFQAKMSHGVVLKVGPGYVSDEGTQIVVTGIQSGDTVYWAAVGGTALEVEGREVYVIPARNVVLVRKMGQGLQGGHAELTPVKYDLPKTSA